MTALTLTLTVNWWYVGLAAGGLVLLVGGIIVGINIASAAMAPRF